jgi:hypothetical protein
MDGAKLETSRARKVSFQEEFSHKTIFSHIGKQYTSNIVSTSSGFYLSCYIDRQNSSWAGRAAFKMSIIF